MKQFREVRLIVAFCAALIAMIATFVYVSVQKSRDDAIENAYRDTHTSAAVFAEQATRTFRLLDSVMQMLAWELARQPTPSRLQELVSQNLVSMDTLVLVSFVDKNGRTLGSNLGPDPNRTDLSDREHIRVHLDGKVDGLYIGKPVLGRVSGKWSIQLTRAVRDASHQIIGVLVVSVDPHYFERFWRGLSETGDDVTELIGFDGGLRTRSSDVERALSERPDRTLVVSATSGATNGRFEYTDPQGRTFLTSFVKLEELPLLVTSGVDRRATLARARDEARAYLLIGVGTAALVFIFGAMLTHLARRLQASTSAAREAERRLSEAIEAIPGGFALFDSNDRLVVFNNAYRQLYPRMADHIVVSARFPDLLKQGLEIGQYSFPEGRQEEWARARLERHRNPAGPFEQVTDAGRWLRIEEKKTADGGVVGIRTDITELKQRQADLTRQTSLLQTTLQHMGEGIAVYDGERHLIAINPVAKELIELPDWLAAPQTTYDEIVRFQARRQDFGDVDVETEVARRVANFLSRETWIDERRRRDGRTIEIWRNSMPDGGAVVLYRDVTLRKDYEARINNALSEAEAGSRAKSEFLALISHEIRTPMNAIIGMSGLLVESGLDPQRSRYARAIEDAGEKMLVIINDLLDFSRLEAGRLALETGPFDLRSLLRGALDIARALPTAANLAFTSQVGPDVPDVLIGDSGRINQILLNLLGNAVKFTARGSVEVCVSVVRRQDDFCLWRCTVRDTGPGIPDEYREQLFEPFEQGPTTTTGRVGGTGLGLAICRKLAELMGGAIGVESAPGAGSAFWFELPSHVGEIETPVATSNAVATLSQQRLRVLVAEDVPANQMVVRAMLESLGHRPHVVGDGAEAIEAVREVDYDLVLMDIQMPGVDGYEAMRRIRAMGGRYAALPIVALTAFAQASDIDSARAAGATEFLTKPIRKRDLAQAIERLFAGVGVPDAHESGSSGAFDATALNDLKQDLGAQRFQALLRKYIADIETRLATLAADAPRPEPQATRRVAHQLRGLLGQAGALGAASAAGDLETADEADLQARIDILRAMATFAVGELQSALEAA